MLILLSCFKGTVALLVAVATDSLQRKLITYYSSFQFTNNGGKCEDNKLLQCSHLRQHDEFQHVSISAQRESGRNLWGPFVKAVLVYWQ